VSTESARIGILCPGYGMVLRGVEIFIGEMVTRLREIQPDWSFDIYCRARSGEVAPGVHLIHVPAVDRDGHSAALYAKVGHHLRYSYRTRIDAECLSFTLTVAPRLLRAHHDLIFNQAGPFAGWLCQWTRWRHGTPFVHKTASGFGELETVMAMQRPDAIVATSPHAMRWIERECPGSSVQLIPNAVDTTTFRPYSDRELAAFGLGMDVLKLKRPILLFVGAMDPMKRPHLLLDAMARVPEASLVMVGTGHIADSLLSIYASALGDRFLYLPKVPREQMPFYYNACDLFTLPSDEPFGIAFVEAMACNKPVLAHKSPVQKWLFGDAGRLCDCTNPDEYAGTIRRMLSTDFGDLPLERSKSFDWSQVASCYADLFSRLMY
jgi:glycosyltransferase involved in cell wall biosynthesis